jgi:hypothetical protein
MKKRLNWDQHPWDSLILPKLEIDAAGTRRWIVDGKPHHIGRPAVEYVNGTNLWCQFGYYHRINGPAIERHYTLPDEWWYQGEYIRVSNLKDFQSYVRNKAFW